MHIHPKSMTPVFWQEAKKHLNQQDPVLGKLITRYKGELMVTRGDAFFTLARAIAGQQISVKAADSIWGRLTATLPSITPEAMLNADDAAIRACGFSGSKVIYLKSLAKHFVNNKASIAEWEHMTDEAIISELVSIKGIGRWSAEMYLIFHLARPDILPVGDLGLLKAIYLLYNNGEKMPLAKLRAIAAPWAPYRSVATWYLWRSLDPVPVAY